MSQRETVAVLDARPTRAALSARSSSMSGRSASSTAARTSARNRSTASGVAAMRRRRTKCAKLGSSYRPAISRRSAIDLVEDLEVPRGAAIQIPDVVAPPRVLVFGVRHERVEVGVVERQQVVALVVARLAREKRLGQPAHLVGSERQPRLVVAQVARELLREHRHPLGDRLGACPAIGRQRDAGVLE